jgi:hypothetical protein
MAIERQLFDWVLDAFEGFAHDVDGPLHSTSHRRGLKVWYGDAKREHYEAQLIRTGDGARLEIGFHAEYPKPEENDVVLARLLAVEDEWRPELGAEAVAGPFIGADHWRRISEVWEAPDPDDPETAIEIAARLADYVIALEPVRRV